MTEESVSTCGTFVPRDALHRKEYGSFDSLTLAQDDMCFGLVFRIVPHPRFKCNEQENLSRSLGGKEA